MGQAQEINDNELRAQWTAAKAMPDFQTMINADLGYLESSDGEVKFVTSTKSGGGCAVFGPWLSLEAGRYEVTFDVSIGDYPAFYQDMVCGILEVTTNYATIIITRSWLYASRLLSGQRVIKLEFEISDAEAVEFRVHTTGRAPLSISLFRPVTRLPPAHRTYSPVLLDGLNLSNRFFIDHYADFRNLFEAGVTIRATDQTTIAEISNVSFYVENVEDFQIINEIFIKGEYNFLSRKQSLVVDVGMNVGLLSLHMANQPNVVEVHAYEPFVGPYSRAMKNFSLNKNIAKKINANCFALGDKDEFLDVAVSDEKTIGTSIKGRDNGTNPEGTPETIEVRDASVVFNPIFTQAENRGLDIVLKLDCEGSEFPILSVLDQAGLLEKVSVLFIEWHKAWSPDLTQKNIIDRLVPKGFIVLDRTQSQDVWAGQLYAIRAD